MPQATDYVFISVDLPVAEAAEETQCHGKNTKLRVRTLEGESYPCLSCNGGHPLNFSTSGFPLWSLPLTSLGHDSYNTGLEIPKALA